jgi:hypothetical protein
MGGRDTVRACAVVTAFMMSAVAAWAFDESKYPDMQGQWARPAGTGIQWDPTKPIGRAQQPPLTPEYQAVWEASMADQAAGGQGNDPAGRCIPIAMPRMMSAVFPMEIVITPHTTYILSDYSTPRRIYTDGRAWPTYQEPNFLGYTIGKWIDENGDGRFDVLEAETRHLKGPHVYEASGIPFHADSETSFKERFYLDRDNPDILHDEITSFDHALTRPWTIVKNYRRERANVIWFQNNCDEDNHHVYIGKEDYFVGADGLIWPAKKGQPRPDLRHFE